ncbi:MAG: hypothetical protein M3Q52_08630 [Pseudomonadota bacterium]|nr:hypothetical protein [Pseudomonadota bacterium]
MTPEQILRDLLEGAATMVEPPLLNERKLARFAWIQKSTAQWREALRQMDDRCMEAISKLDEEAFDRLFEAEQAKVAAIRAQLQAVVDEGRWPPELHFNAI